MSIKNPVWRKTDLTSHNDYTLVQNKPFGLRRTWKAISVFGAKDRLHQKIIPSAHGLGRLHHGHIAQGNNENNVSGISNTIVVHVIIIAHKVHRKCFVLL